MNFGKIKIKEAIIVEGRYDKNTLSQIIDAVIIECSGFQVFRNQETRDYILSTAKETGIVILTDADASGFMIRSEIHGFVPAELILDAYIPPIEGKERRKEKPGKEGLLGVEGMTRDVLLKALTDAGVTFLNLHPDSVQADYNQIDSLKAYSNQGDSAHAASLHAASPRAYSSQSDSTYEISIHACVPAPSDCSSPAPSPVTPSDLFSLGLNGSTGSRQKKEKLLKAMQLPSHLNTKELLAVINRRMTLAQLEELCRTLKI